MPGGSRYEVKWDGYRALAITDGARVQLEMGGVVVDDPGPTHAVP